MERPLPEPESAPTIAPHEVRRPAPRSVESDSKELRERIRKLEQRLILLLLFVLFAVGVEVIFWISQTIINDGLSSDCRRLLLGI